MSDLCRRSCFGVSRGGVRVRDLCRSRGGVLQECQVRSVK